MIPVGSMELASSPLALPRAEETKKQKRERENLEAPGGLRSPWMFVRCSAAAQSTGDLLAKTIDAFIDQNPEVINWLVDGGGDGRKKFRAQAELLLAQKFGDTLQTADVGLSPNGRWLPGLLQAYCLRAGDPERYVPTWLRGGAPSGVSERIPASGVFRRVKRKRWAWKNCTRCTIQWSQRGTTSRPRRMLAFSSRRFNG